LILQSVVFAITLCENTVTSVDVHKSHNFQN